MSRELFDQYSQPFTPVEEGSAAGGDLALTYPDPMVVGIRQVAISSAVPNAGDVLTATGPSDAEWAAPTLPTVDSETTGLTVGSTTAAMAATRFGFHETFKNLKAAGSAVVVFTVGGALPAVTQPGHPRCIEVAFGGIAVPAWNVNQGVIVSGIGADGVLLQESVAKPVIGNARTSNAFLTITDVQAYGGPTATLTATLTVSAEIGVGNRTRVLQFLGASVDGVSDATPTTDVTYGTFYPSIAYTGASQTVEVWYNSLNLQSSHTHSVTDPGHTHNLTP